LVEKHKAFEEELSGRTDQVESLKKTAEELLASADREDAIKINAQVSELTNAWEKVWGLSKNKTRRLEDALKQAEELHKSVNMLLEWLSDAEMKLRFSGPLPEDEDEVKKQIEDHEKFMKELREKEKDKDYTLKLAHEILAKCHPDAVNVIKHWITIIQSRWDEVASWALQRYEKLQVCWNCRMFFLVYRLFAIFEHIKISLFYRNILRNSKIYLHFWMSSCNG
jgi:dystonin